MADENNILKWRFDVSTFRLIGRELITDRITALFELVKNCYDANAEQVFIEFVNVNSINDESKIIIKDNGCGMTFEDVRDKWMVIGTASKRRETYSPEPYKRKYVGEKGIGRFAVDKLGHKVIISTKTIGSSSKLVIDIDWHAYENAAANDNLTLFTEIENRYTFSVAEPSEKGTTLEILNIREVWTKQDIDRLYRELSKIVSPFYPLNPPFNIFISSNEYNEYKEKPVEAEAIKYASHHASISFDPSGNYQESLKFDTIQNAIITERLPIKSFGGVKMQFFYFNPTAKRIYHVKYKMEETRIDGVKIYRDGVITTPFAEFEDHPDKKRDILGIDKRLWRDIFNKISTREIIGIVDITKDGNPKIIDATNRQDFVENDEYKELKEFIIDQLDTFSKLKIYERDYRRKGAVENLKKAGEDVGEFVQTIEQLENQQPELKPVLEPLKKQAKLANTSIKKGISEQKKAEKEYLRKENIYLSLMSLQDYAINIAHAVRTSLSKVKNKAEFFKMHYPSQSLEDFFKIYANEIFDEMQTLNKVIDFMLSYAGSNLSFEELNVKELIVNLFNEYALRFESENIQTLIEIQDNFIINANRQFFADIFQNLIVNSIKAMQTQPRKIIKCSGHIEDDCFILFFSDSGSGIEPELRDKVFELYYTTTASQGGAGIGLFIVKTRIESLKGTVEIVENEFLPSGATFKITFPFKK